VIYDSLTNFNMKKLIALLIVGLVVFSGCDLFKQAPADTEPEADNTVVEETTDKPEVTEEDPVVEDPVVNEPPPVITPPVVEKTPTEPAAAESKESAEVLLAKCLTASGAKLYAASWCGHCQKQKAAFADGLEYLDNTECAVDDGWAQACKDADVSAVPTWILSDGTVKTGNTPLATLAELTSCEYNA